MKITVLPGDGIGPEVTREATKVLDDVCSLFNIDLEFEDHLVGGAAITTFQDPLPEETVAACLESRAVLLGAVGAPEFDGLPPAKRPESGLLRLRKELGGFANLRPAKACEALVNASPLRPSIFAGTDLLIVRELLGGLYFGEPRGYDEEIGEACNTLTYNVEEVNRVARVAFECASRRSKKLTSVDKANVLESSRLWRKTVEEVSREFKDVRLEHMYVDSCAMHLVTDPARFDVILTENLFGDILSDEASVLTGSIGTLPSATIGGKVDLYEPVHGSAPEIADQGVANPLAAISCVAMMFRETLDNDEVADVIEQAIERVLAAGYRTADIASGGNDKVVSTREMGNLLGEFVAEEANIARAYHAV